MDEQKTPTFASEQLAVVKFHRSPGAYALLLETDLVRQQIARLATGTVQRFVQPEQFRAIVLPEIDIATAQDWHQRLIDILRNKRAAWKELAELKKGMHLVYRQIHPAFTSDAQLELAVECKQ